MPRIALSAHLSRLVPALPDDVRVLLLKAIDKLRRNQFDAGLRVKKMRAKPRVAVWEARVNGAGRLLFTYGHHAERRSARSSLIAHVWTLVPDHDDVARILRRRSFQAPEAMSWVMEEELDSYDWSSALPENPAADLYAIEQDFSDTERWEAYAALSSDYQPALTVPPEHLPWYLDGPVAFADWADGSDLPAELLLSDEQVELLRESLPLFVNGPAGSGKTTLALYKLLALQEANPELRLAFVAHNPRLVARAEELFNALPTRAEKARTVSFLTYDALLAEVLTLSKTGLSRFVATRRELGHFLERHPLSRAERALFIADIRALLKGALPPDLTPARPEDVSDLLSLEVYRNLPLRWSALPISRREEAYRLACLYQEHLQSRDLFDDQDLASRALRALLGNQSRRYDVLVLDEVQDLTEKQLRVVLTAPRARRGTGLLLAGDPTQTLAESGFGWRIPRSVFAERGWDVPRPVTLARSFRAGAPTLRLAHAIAVLLKREGADVVSLNPEQARASGALPVRVAPHRQLDDALAVGRPDVIVLVADDDQVALLRARWGHPFVWSVEEAKGLEADHVVLYQLPDRLRHLPGGSPAKREAAKQENRRALRLHYVAATRARESVTAVVYPYPDGSLWAEEAVMSAASTVSVFDPPWQGEPSAEEWRGRGSYYRDFEQWAAAGACYSRAGDEDWATALRALDESDDAISTIESIRSVHEKISTPCAAFLLDHYGTIDDMSMSVWLLRQAGHIDEADALQAEHDEAKPPSAIPVEDGYTHYSGGRIVALDSAGAKIDFGAHGHYKPAYDEFDDPGELRVGMLVDVLHNEQRGASEWIKVRGHSNRPDTEEAASSVNDPDSGRGVNDRAELRDYDELMAEKSGFSVEQQRHIGRMLSRMMNSSRLWDFDHLPESWTAGDESTQLAVELRTEATQLKRVGDLNGALEALNAASEYAPSHYVNYYNAGKVRYLMGDLDRTVAEYLKATHLLVVEAHFVQIKRSRQYRRLFRVAAEATRVVTQSENGMIYPERIPGMAGTAADEESVEREADVLEALWPHIYQTEFDHHLTRHAGHAWVDLHRNAAKLRKKWYVRRYADSIAGKASRSKRQRGAVLNQQIENAYHQFGLQLLRMNLLWFSLDPSLSIADMLASYDQPYSGTVADELLLAYWSSLWEQVR